MTVPAFLRRWEPLIFGSVGERSWRLRERVAAYTRPSVLSEMTGWPSCSDAGSSRLGTDWPPVLSLSPLVSPPVPSAGGLTSCLTNQRPGRSLVGEHVRAIETEG